mgnify:FL=1
MSDIKLRVAKFVADLSIGADIDYNILLNHIYDCKYRMIDKVPIDIYFIGIITRFVITDISHANKLLEVLKEVTQDVLETTGIECTFVDEDWEDIFVTKYTSQQYNIDSYYLSTDKENKVRYKSKDYMNEFF